MKKILLGTSAIALAGAFASPAASAEWEVRVGGYMEQFVAFATSDFDDGRDGQWDGIDSKQDAEIWFLPKITLDNGISFGANIQLEGLTDSDQIDESHMIIKGSFGEIILGSENSAGYKMTYAAPDVTFINVNSGSTTAFIPWTGDGAGDDAFRATLGTTFLEVNGNNDAQRFTYFTPRFSGFQLGVSYARDGNQDSNAQVDTDSELSDIFDLGANYVQSFGDFNVAVSGRYGKGYLKGESNPEIWSLGLNLGASGFTVGGSYAEQNKAGVLNGEAYDLGISYETGPWGVSFTYFRGKNKGNPDGTGLFAISGDIDDLDIEIDDDGEIVTLTGLSSASGTEVTVAEDGNETVDQFLLGISYDLAKGVNLGAYAAYIDFDDAGGGVSDDSIDGWIIGTGVKIKF